MNPFHAILVLSVLFIGLLSTGCQIAPPQSLSLTNVNLILGNPSHALSLTDQNTYTILRPQYAALYNRQRNTADWVSWQLNSTWLGDLPRPPFTPDPELPVGWYHVTPGDYTGSGFDRGHLVPAADRNRSVEDLAAVFYMSNIVPQSPDSNQGPWETLERYCRRLVSSGKELYIIAGPLGQGGIGRNGFREAIGKGQVMVPEALWKIVVVNDQVGQGLQGITAKTRVIAVIIPNQQGIKETDWQQYRTSIRDIETKTGLDFLSNLSPELKGQLETQRDNSRAIKNVRH